MRAVADFHRSGDASGMPDPEMCVSGGDFLCLSGVLDAEKVRRGKRIRKAKLYSSACYASHLQVIITKTDVNIVL